MLQELRDQRSSKATEDSACTGDQKNKGLGYRRRERTCHVEGAALAIEYMRVGMGLVSAP